MKDALDNQTIDKLNNLVKEPENSSDNNIDNGDRKIDGAIAEVSRRAELDATIENNLSTGLSNPKFEAASRKINKERNVYTSSFKSTLKLKKDSLKNTLKLKNNSTAKENLPPYVLDDEHKQAMKELEEEMTDSFNKEVYSRLAEMNKEILLNNLVDNPLSQEKSEIINLVVSEAYHNVVAFSDNGYLMQLVNKEEVKTEHGTDYRFDIKNEKAQYNLIDPSGLVLAEKINYEAAIEGIEILANGYLQKLKEEFNQVENSLEEDNKVVDAEKNNIELSELTAEDILGANSFDELKVIIDKSNGIKESQEHFTKEMLINIINSIQEHEEVVLTLIPSTGGFRNKVESLLAQPDADYSKFLEHFKVESGERETWIGQNIPHSKLIRLNILYIKC